MPSYFITGAARGIGYEFLRQYSSDPENLIIGTVRNKAVTEKKVSEDPELKGRSNIRILEADVTRYSDLQKAAQDAAKITGGKLDYVIANAGIVPMFDAYDPIGNLGDRPEEVEKTLRDVWEIHVIANVHLFHLLTPLIFKGDAKKVIAVTTGFSDIDFTNKWDMTPSALYAASKAGLNMIVAKFSAQYKSEGVLFMAVCPGMVEVGHYDGATDNDRAKLGGTVAKFMQYAPEFKGPISPEESVTCMRKVIDEASLEKNGGDFVSHFGTKQWL